jgi:hypothetical protein
MAQSNVKAKPSAAVVGLHALSAEQALSWLAESGSVSMPATELARAWGWPARRAQRQLTRWQDDGRIRRRGRTITVIGRPISATPAATAPATPGDTQNDAAVTSDRPALRLALTALVLTPVAGLNVWPRVAQLLAGATDPSGWSLVAFQILALFILAQIPFAMGGIQSWIARIVLAGFAIVLVSANLVFSVEAIGHVRDAARDHNRAIAASIVSLSRELEERRTERTGLAAFTPTTPAEIASAQHAVDEAVTARDQECGKVGDNCRKRVAELGDRELTLARLQSSKSIGDRATELDTKIGEIEDQLRALGPLPLMQDPGAARLAMLTFGKLSADQVSDGLPTALSFVAEICALLGPFVLCCGVMLRPRRVRD